jgi:hypothetical protein
MAMRMGKMLIISDHPQDVGPIFRQSYQFESAGAAQYPRYLPPLFRSSATRIELGGFGRTKKGTCAKAAATRHGALNQTWNCRTPWPLFLNDLKWNMMDLRTMASKFSWRWVFLK